MVWKGRRERSLTSRAKGGKGQSSRLTLFVCIVSLVGLLRPERSEQPKLAVEKTNLYQAWKTNRETCMQWIGAQRLSRAYLDFYLIGVQKGATSELATRLWDLGVMHNQMRKSWEYLEKLKENNFSDLKTALHQPFTRSDLDSLRLPHFLSGFPNSVQTIQNEESVPVIDGSIIQERKVVYDGSVESMLSDRVAFLAHALTPHAKIVLTIREPISRALSEYNMLIRIHNRDIERQGNVRPKKKATASQFDLLVRKEMKRLTECGYHQPTGNLNVTTTELLDCVFPRPFSIEGMLFVTRGLYHLHIDTWRGYFPAHRMMFIRFTDVTSGNEEAMQNLAQFLCLRPYPASVLEKYKKRSSNISYGMQAAAAGLPHVEHGFDYYGGSNRYLVNILDSTKRALAEFYAPANERLFALMGTRMF